jgi:membrane protease YdiL (CAAX protease family)
VEEAGLSPFAGFDLWTFYAVPWAGGLFVAAVLIMRGRPWYRAVGVGLMSVPVWDLLWQMLDAFTPENVRTFITGGPPPPPLSPYRLSSISIYKIINDIGYLVLGFLLWRSDGTLHGIIPDSYRAIARDLARAGFPTGRRTEGQSMLVGVVAFPLLLAVTYGLTVAAQGIDALRQTDETAVFSRMTPYHALLLSAAAAFGEELLYRGLVLTALRHPFIRQPRQVRALTTGAAIFVQAVLFGIAHSGYGTWIHVILPTLFGLVAGIAAWRFGIWCPIVLHFFVDVVAFGAETYTNHAWFWNLLVVLILANLLFSLAWLAWKGYSRLRPRGAPT